MPVDPTKLAERVRSLGSRASPLHNLLAEAVEIFEEALARLADERNPPVKRVEDWLRAVAEAIGGEG